MDTILFFQRNDTYAARLRLEGLSAFAREIGWHVQVYTERFDRAALNEVLDFWRPVGTVLSVNDRQSEFDASLFDPARTILLDCFPPRRIARAFSGVFTDSPAAVELAARELAAKDCRDYGFVPWSVPYAWSENRLNHFASLLARLHRRLHVFAPSREGLAVKETQRELIAWLRALPKPCGILAANDRAADNLLTACLLAHVSVPFECAVVGVDDEVTVCEGTNPTLSSVRLDFKESGYRAGALLAELVAGRLAARTAVTVPPLGLVRRNSSRTFLRTDRFALTASEVIRAKACDGLAARDVLAVFPCSRRLAEIRFRNATGHSVLDEIRAVRLERAKKLLRNPQCDLAAVANLCGYASTPTFARIFKAATGMTMSAYRRAARTAR